MKPVGVVRHGDVISRVVEADGSIAMAGPRAPVDGGGFADHKAALHLAAQINERRHAKGGFEPALVEETAEVVTVEATAEAPVKKPRSRRGRH